MSYIQEKIKENYPSRHTIVVPNCINVKRGTQSLRHLCRQAPRIIAVNNGFFGRKNGEVLLLAFDKIAQRYPQVQLHLFGRGYEPDGEAAIWAAAVGVLRVRAAAGYYRLRPMVTLDCKSPDDFYTCSAVATTYTLAVLRRSIYLP